MCQAKKDGGRRCAIHHPATLATKALIAETTMLNEGQINHAFRYNRAHMSRDEAPSPAEYRQHFARLIRAVSVDPRFDDKTRTRLTNRLERAFTFDQIPNANIFEAQIRLIDSAQAMNVEFDNELRRRARATGKSEQETLDAFNEHYVSTVNSPAAPEHLLDARTRTALERVFSDQSVRFEETPRISKSATVDETITAGYDPEDGRLEVTVGENDYAFRGVSPEVYEEMRHNPMDTLNNLANDPAVQYDDTNEARIDAHRVWCQACHRYRLASGHVCRESQMTQQLITRAQEINAQARATGENDIRRTPVPRPGRNRQFQWASNTPIVFDGDYTTTPGSARPERTTNAVAYAPESADALRAEFQAQGNHSIKFRLGRRIPIQGEDGHYEVYHEYMYRTENGNVRGSIAKNSRRLRCTCPEYQENYYCKHSHPRAESVDDLRGKGNALAIKDINASVAHLEEQIAEHNSNLPDGTVYEFDIPEGETLTAEQLSDVALARRRNALTTLILNTGDETHQVNIPRDSYIARVPASLPEPLADQFNSITFDTNPDPNAHLVHAFNAWQLNEESIDTRFGRVAYADDPEPGYRDNVDQFLTDYNDALSSPPQEVALESVTNEALGTRRGEGAGFGVELEVEISHHGRQRVAERLHAEGLSTSSRVQGYHVGDTSTWTVETDCTVGAEIVSPILYDNAEDWENLSRVCRVIREEGGEVSTNAGGHIHIGREAGGDSERVFAASLAHMDTLRRISTDPDRGEHRTLAGNGYANPFQEETVTNAYDFGALRGQYYASREHSVNLTGGDTVEFREPDASLDPAQIQARVMFASAIMQSSKRDNWDDLNQGIMPSQRPGTNHARIQRVDALNIEDESEATLAREYPLIASLDSLFEKQEQRERVLRATVRAPWQAAVRRRW